ncbi:ferredoxin--NADP reductase [Blastopirellula marina]|uniref:ferredoxin--NADP(+) reductase n=1 Tax=Blastopirellula marina TaxID=124 RepID=A0A2S8F0H2_9BACT|nr:MULTISPECIES: ferredoxin--NADP reductase [Pirellulaceae]PQO25633.1 ferredoxin--NADP reductase [Blastopirellula marina]RCS43316.1 ferredoxin--NADP reductase [Bremerella cremea]
MTTPLNPNEKADVVRESIYNAHVVEIVPIHESLRILRIEPDVESIRFMPGQYLSLGLGKWEHGDSLEVAESEEHGHLIQRAYSISCPILDDTGKIVRANDLDYLEFYITLVSHSLPHPPSLTPRLFHLNVGDRLWVGKHAHGNYTLRSGHTEEHLVFVATGTGEAPHNGMIVELLSKGYNGPITSIVCVRQRQDLGYLRQHMELERQFPNYQYVPLTTREPENISPTRDDYIGKRYVQDVFRNWEEIVPRQPKPNPKTSQVYLCGNPAMIGAPQSLQQVPRIYPTPIGVVEILERQGFRLDQPRLPGNIHTEKYW